MLLSIKCAVISLLFAVFGMSAAWCDSCGELYVEEELVSCNSCSAHVCETCLIEDGCYCCID